MIWTPSSSQSPIATYLASQTISCPCTAPHLWTIERYTCSFEAILISFQCNNISGVGSGIYSSLSIPGMQFRTMSAKNNEPRPGPASWEDVAGRRRLPAGVEFRSFTSSICDEILLVLLQSSHGSWLTRRVWLRVRRWFSGSDGWGGLWQVGFV